MLSELPPDPTNTCRITSESNRLRAAVTSLAYASAAPVPQAFVRAGQTLGPCSRLIRALYGPSLQMWPKGPMGASPAVVSPRGNKKGKVAIVPLLYGQSGKM